MVGLTAVRLHLKSRPLARRNKRHLSVSLIVAPSQIHGIVRLKASVTARDNSNPRSRWEEIRAASARKAQTSSWDALRQDHERAAVSDNVQSASIPFPLNGVDPERAQEQARFDALLEAERKMARG